MLKSQRLIPTNFVIPVTGVLLYASGVLIKNAERNWFAGIRTPWTLSSDYVWDKTHQLGGYIFKGCWYSELFRYHNTQILVDSHIADFDPGRCIDSSDLLLHYLPSTAN